MIIEIIELFLDINECEEETHNCSINATCTDTEGAFNCSCHVGLEGNGYECTGCETEFL